MCDSFRKEDDIESHLGCRPQRHPVFVPLDRAVLALFRLLVGLRELLKRWHPSHVHRNLDGENVFLDSVQRNGVIFYFKGEQVRHVL